MKAEIYQKAFHLKEYELSEESITEFKRILEVEGDPLNICHRMISALYYYRLSDPEQAMPYALQSVSYSPLMKWLHCVWFIVCMTSGIRLKWSRKFADSSQQAGNLIYTNPFLKKMDPSLVISRDSLVL